MKYIHAVVHGISFFKPLSSSDFHFALKFEYFSVIFHFIEKKMENFREDSIEKKSPQISYPVNQSVLSSYIFIFILRSFYFAKTDIIKLK